MKKFPYLHIILFILTFFSTLIAGAVFQKGINILKEPSRIYEGLPFSLTLMGILLSHELSHFFASKKHHTSATLPYFIPAPITLIGTFGAFIKMKSPIVTRKALIDIGASGPIAGFLLSLLASVIGLSYSTVVPLSNANEGVLTLGDSMLFSFLSRLVVGTVPDSHEILLHPVAFAGWIGFFVTSLNLIPIGQLDGGHVAYAFLRERHRIVSLVLAGLLISFGLIFWEGWAFWGFLMVLLGLRHPPVIHWEVSLDIRRRLVGLITFIIFLITFIPSPFRIL
jgi:membrane-associated protease RseP (regulator of RpoE activity)